MYYNNELLVNFQASSVFTTSELRQWTIQQFSLWRLVLGVFGLCRNSRVSYKLIEKCISCILSRLRSKQDQKYVSAPTKKKKWRFNYLFILFHKESVCSPAFKKCWSFDQKPLSNKYWQSCSQQGAECGALNFVRKRARMNIRRSQYSISVVKSQAPKLFWMAQAKLSC